VGKRSVKDQPDRSALTAMRERVLHRVLSRDSLAAAALSLSTVPRPILAVKVH